MGVMEDLLLTSIVLGIKQVNVSALSSAWHTSNTYDHNCDRLKETSPGPAVTGIHRAGRGPRARLSGSNPASVLLGGVPSCKFIHLFPRSVSSFMTGLP